MVILTRRRTGKKIKRTDLRENTIVKGMLIIRETEMFCAWIFVFG